MIVNGKISKEYKRAIDFFATKLFKHQLKRHLFLDVRLCKHLDALGYTSVEGYNYSDKPRDFLIEVNKNQNQVEILKTLAHEMVHVRQYVNGDLNDEGTIWKGQPIPRKKHHDVNAPWEIEAEEVGQQLYDEYVKSNVNNTTK
jgi:hypothetical protein